MASGESGGHRNVGRQASGGHRTHYVPSCGCWGVSVGVLEVKTGQPHGGPGSVETQKVIGKSLVRVGALKPQRIWWIALGAFT